MIVPTNRWVIGHGLLGRAVVRSRPDTPFSVPIDWRDPERSSATLAAAAHAFLTLPGQHEIYWCAGRGVTSTPRVDLQTEVEVFDSFLASLGKASNARDAELALFLSSSVGGAYGGVDGGPFTEHSPVAAASAYGDAKLQMERAAAMHGAASGWRTVIGRLTNLYGPGQDLSKAQGLISTLVNSAITQQPATIFVALDTLRDYIYEDDAATVISGCMARAHSLARGECVVKIIGSGHAVSVGAIIGELRRLRRRSGFSLVSQGTATGQSQDLRIRSEVWSDLDDAIRTPLPQGLDRVMRARLEILARGVTAT